MIPFEGICLRPFNHSYTDAYAGWSKPPPPPPPPWLQFLFVCLFVFLLACLSERSVMYEDTPTPCLGNWLHFFFFEEREFFFVRVPLPATTFSGLVQHHPIGDFRNVFKFHAYSVNKRLFLTTAKLVRGLSDVATTNVCKVDTSNRNHIERSRWMKWLITWFRQKNYALIWIHYESGLVLETSLEKNAAYIATWVIWLFLPIFPSHQQRLAPQSAGSRTRQTSQASITPGDGEERGKYEDKYYSGTSWALPKCVVLPIIKGPQKSKCIVDFCWNILV